MLFAIAAFVQLSYAQTFSDIAPEQGVDIWIDGSSFGVGCSFYDFNKDGWDDLSIGQVGAAPRFFQNNNGQLQEIDLGIPNTGEIKHILWVDYDNDGDADLFISKYIGQARLYRNDGDLSLTDVSNECGFSTDPLRKTWGCAWGDYDGDGFLDVYWADYSFETGPDAMMNKLYHNNGDGTFTDVTDDAGVSNGSVLSFQPAWLDYDLDGDQDLHLINDRHAFENALYHNNGDGSFIDLGELVGLGEAFDAMSNTAVDFDRDGDLDISITNGIYGNRMYRNNGDLTYTDIAQDLGIAVFRVCWASSWSDFDNDGWEDLYVCTEYESQDTAQNFAFNNFEGSFSPLLEGGFSDDKSEAFSIILGDVNNDGFGDLYMPAESGPYPTRFWLNDATSGNNHLKVSLEGVVSNRDGIGSWIKAYIGDTALVRYTFCGEDYLCQDSQREIIGLGQHEVVDSLEIVWLSGHVDTFYEVASNQTLHIIEGSSIDPPDWTYLTFCEGDSIALDGGDYSNFLWNTGDTTQIIITSVPGTYFASATNEFGLPIQTDTIYTEWLPEPDPDVIMMPVSCHDAEDGSLELITLNWIGFEDILWNSGDSTQYITNLAAGEYTCDYVSIFGCPGVISAELINPDPLEIELTIENNGGVDAWASASASGGWGNFIYDWYHDDELIGTSPLLDELGPGQYSVVVTDIFNCQDTAVFVITNLSEELFPHLAVFPNPSANSIILTGLPDDAYLFQIHDSTGRISSSSRHTGSAVSIDLKNVGSGLYFLSIMGDSGKSIVLTLQRL